MTLTVGSVCSGMGGLELALDLWLGSGAAQPQWFAETDPDASRVLKTWWPEVPNLGDFTAADWTAPRCDVEVGGVPCQGFSAAGRQLGAADPRHLWPDWRRGIEARRPTTVIFENVANLVRGKMRPIFDSIIADLLALGYDVRWCLLGACAVGAAHHRHRVFLLACRSRTTPNARQVQVQTCGQSVAAYLPTPSAVSYGSNQGGGAGRTGPVRHSLDALARLELLPTTTARDASTRGEGSEDYWRERRAEGFTGGVPLGAALSLLPTPVKEDATRGVLSNSAGRAWTLKENRTSSGMLGTELVNLLPSPRASDGSNGGPNQGIASGDVALSSAVQPERWGKYAQAIVRHEAVLGRPAPEPTEIGPKGGRRLAAAFSEWLMMLPAGHLVSVLDRNPALARAGNGVVPLQAATALRLLYADLVQR